MNFDQPIIGSSKKRSLDEYIISVVFYLVLGLFTIMNIKSTSPINRFYSYLGIAVIIISLLYFIFIKLVRRKINSNKSESQL
jgi:cell division protein FtsW (lipid II flippase)